MRQWYRTNQRLDSKNIGLVQKWLFGGNSSCRKGVPLWNNGDGLGVCQQP